MRTASCVADVVLGWPSKAFASSVEVDAKVRREATDRDFGVSGFSSAAVALGIATAARERLRPEYVLQLRSAWDVGQASWVWKSVNWSGPATEARGTGLIPAALIARSFVDRSGPCLAGAFDINAYAGKCLFLEEAQACGRRRRAKILAPQPSFGAGGKRCHDRGSCTALLSPLNWSGVEINCIRERAELLLDGGHER